MKIKIRKKFLPITRPFFGKEEKKELIATINSGWITLGPKTHQFEKDLAKYLGVKYVIALNSCSAALHLAMLAIDLKPGDEVITTTFTFAATAHAILHCGAKPVFVDIDPKTFNIDPKLIEEKITSKTKAILPVHYGGHPVNLDAINKIAEKYKLYVVEDAAFAIGAKYKNKFVGTISDLTCFSFHPVKIITTGDGGAITTNNKKLADKLLVLRANGMDKEAWNRHAFSGSWDYSVTTLGFKYHMNDIQASLGIHQLKRIEKFLKMREQLIKIYDKELVKIKGVTIPYRESNIRHTNNVYPMLIDVSTLKINRNDIVNLLKSFNIGTNVFFRPLHMQPFFKDKYKFKDEDFPVAKDVFEKLINLPLFPGMRKQDVMYVIQVLKSIIDDNKKG